MGFANLGALVTQFAPHVYLHPDEQWKPASAEWYMAKVEYVQADPSQTFKVGEWSFDGSSSTTKVAGGPLDYMQIPGDDGTEKHPPKEVAHIRDGDVAVATAYVHVLPVYGTDDQIDLQYWLFYPFNGAEYFYCAAPLVTPAVTDLDVSYHEGDFECVTVRISDDSQVVAAAFSQHGSMVWMTQAVSGESGGFQIEDGTHVVAYAARGSHANYPTAGGPFMIGGIDVANFTIGIADFTGAGTLVDYSQPNRAIVIANDAANLVPYTPAPCTWLAFQGRWGLPTTVTFTASAIATIVLTTLEGLTSKKLAIKLVVGFFQTAPGAAALLAIAGLIVALNVGPSQEGPYNPPVQGPWNELDGPDPWAPPATVLPNGYTGGAALLPATATTEAQLLYQQTAGGTISALNLSSSQSSTVGGSSGFGVTGLVLAAPQPAQGATYTGFYLTGAPNGTFSVFGWTDDGTFESYPGATSLPAQSLGALTTYDNGLVCFFTGAPSGGSAPLMYAWASWLSLPGWAAPENVGPSVPVSNGTAPAPAAVTLANGTIVVVFGVAPATAGAGMGLASVVGTMANWQDAVALPIEPVAGDPSSSVASAPALATDGTTILCLYVDGNGQLRLSQSQDGTAWSYPIAIPGGGGVTGTPAIALNKQSLWIVATTSSGAQLWSVALPERLWSGWTGVPNVAAPPTFADAAPVTAAYQDPSNPSSPLDAFVADNNGHVWTNTRTDGAWASAWTELVGSNNRYTIPGGPVTAIYGAAGVLDLFIAGTDGTVYTIARTNGVWESEWNTVGQAKLAAVGAPITAVYRGDDTSLLDLYATNNDDDKGWPWTITRTSGSWPLAWTQVPGTKYSNPGAQVSAVYGASDNLDLFIAGTDGTVWNTSCTNGTWAADWAQVGQEKLAAAGAPITAAYRDPEMTLLDLYVTNEIDGNEGYVQTITRSGSEPWPTQWTAIEGQNRYSYPGGRIELTSSDPTHRELFMVGTNGWIWTTVWDADAGWAPDWTTVNNDVQTSGNGFVAAALGAVQEDLFIAGTNGQIWTTSSQNPS